MSMSKSANTYNRTTWEDSEFPILCQTCLGVNPYLRMMKDKFGGECKICNRPFTTFRWCPGPRMRYKRTEVCQTCAKLKNVCQTCLLDLEYGLPVAVRDYALGLKDDLPKSGANRDFYLQNTDRELAKTDGTTPGGSLAKLVDQGPNDLLTKLARNQPYYDRNKPHICSFWVKGECKRGEECPYRHEKPTDPDDPLSDQNIKDRYYGSKDPVADKLLNRARALPVLRPPEDKSITTLYVGNLGDEHEITEKDLRDYFYQFGEIRNITILGAKGCGFVQFTTRDSAELAAEKTFNKFQLKGRRITIRWGRPQAQQNVSSQLGGAGQSSRQFEPVPGLPGTLPTIDFFNLDPQDGGPDPKRFRPDFGGGGGGVSTIGSGRPPPSFSGGAGFGGGGGGPLPPITGARHSSPLIVPKVPYTPRSVTTQPTIQSAPNVGTSTSTTTKEPPNDQGPSTSTTSSQDSRGGKSGGGIYYPSQDPQHLGAKDLAD